MFIQYCFLSTESLVISRERVNRENSEMGRDLPYEGVTSQSQYLIKVSEIM